MSVLDEIRRLEGYLPPLPSVKKVVKKVVKKKVVKKKEVKKKFYVHNQNGTYQFYENYQDKHVFIGIVEITFPLKYPLRTIDTNILIEEPKPITRTVKDHHKDVFPDDFPLVEKTIDVFPDDFPDDFSKQVDSFPDDFPVVEKTMDSFPDDFPHFPPCERSIADCVRIG